MTVILKEEGNRKLPFDEERLKRYITRVTNIKDEKYIGKVIRSINSHEEFKAESITDLLINTALENVDESEPQWNFDASKIYLETLYKKASRNRSYDKDDKYGDFYGLLKVLASKGIYSPNILKKYTKEEIKEVSKAIEPNRDLFFDYVGLHTLVNRYLAKDYNKDIYELPQERWLVIALILMQDEENENRLEHVKEAYWAMSNMYMTVATPTLANAGLANGQLSSCFIDTVDDSLLDIYNSNTDVAELSKSGGGIGVYMGKVRSRGSDIRGFKGASSGVVPWIKQLNNTAVAVDQLGRRKGAIAVYLDVWHGDILSFLDLRLNNGDERQRAHDIFIGTCIPDLFMETVEKRGDWYLFDPHEVEKVMGFRLEDYYDEEEGSGTFRERYELCVNSNELLKTKVSAISIFARIMKSQLETGTPFMFYRDEVNRKNANKHEGMIYSSNLCTEIAQNMSATIQYDVELDDDIIITRKKAGDFVVCNLSSISLARAEKAKALERLIPIQVRMLDNVIDLNNIPVKQAQRTNERYRGIGLGTFGWHHLLAIEGIDWESEEAVTYADELYERIHFLVMKAEVALAKEKGAYTLFEGSEFQTGKYFERRGYNNKNSVHDWDSLIIEVIEYGVRNGYMEAIAPNGSTSIINGSTATIDPIFKPFYHEEKKDYKLPVVAPDLNYKTYKYYEKSAYKVNQFWSIKQQKARVRHIDQASSFNLYVPNTINAKILLQLHMEIWKAKIKTSYYIRSTALELEECDWCAS